MHKRRNGFGGLRRLLPLAGCLLVLAVGCSPSSQSAHKKKAKKRLVLGISQEPDTLWIPFREMLASEQVIGVGLSTLTIFDDSWNLVPFAAKEIPTQENGGLVLFDDGGTQKMRVTWHLRDEFNWADGKPLIADDFILGWKISADPEQEIIDRTIAEKVERMEAKGPDHKTLVVTFKEPYANYASYRQHEAVPAHIVGPLYASRGPGLKKHPFGNAPLFAGGFTMVQWVPGSHIVARANPYAKGFIKPHLDEIVWRIIPQTNTLEANLLSGTIDGISPLGMSLDQMLDFEKRHGKEFDVHYTEGLVWEHIDFDLQNPILKDKQVRYALAYGANRAAISKNIFGGRQLVADGTWPRRAMFYNDKIRRFPYDPPKAKALLDKAGWKLGPDGIRVKEGKRMSISLMTTSGNKVREQIEQLLQSDWKQIGVDITLKNQPAKVLFGQTLRNRKYGGMVMFAWSKDPLMLGDTLWRCDYIPTKENGWQGQNQPGYCNPKIDALFAKGSRELDIHKRAKIGQEVEALLIEDLPSLPLYFRVEASATRKGLQNWKMTGTLQPVTWDAYAWRWGAAKGAL